MEPTEISSQSRLQRLLRDHGLVAMMITLMLFIAGGSGITFYVIGYGSANLDNFKEDQKQHEVDVQAEVDELKAQYHREMKTLQQEVAVGGIRYQQFLAHLKAMGISPPPNEDISNDTE